MKGPEWIVPVVVLIVWLISTIMKSREAADPVRKRAAGDGPNRKSTGDIDKFLQEIDRLRRKSSEEKGQAPRPTPRTRPVPAPVTRLKPARPAPRDLEPPTVEAVPVVSPAQVVAEIVAPAPAKRVRPTPALPTDRRAPIGATAALHLLRSPRTLASAVVLQEVLGPPRCMRPIRTAAR